MSFKKSNIDKKSSLIPNIIGLISICLIFLLGLFFLKNSDILKFNIDNTINSTDNIEQTTTINEEGNIDNDNNIIGNSNIKTITKSTNSEKNKINILVVGRGGIGHEAPNLTDTIILTSINTKTKSISMLSIPRDFYVDYPGENSGSGSINDGKINGLYAKYKFESGSEKVGMDILKKKISQITGEKIDYHVNVDFDGFTKIIDTIGGIKITVPNHFVDEKYPDGNWGYKTLVFKKGTWIFDGENSLKYARSRHSTSDFDRSMRQQQVIKAIKNKLTGSYFLTSPGKVKELYNVFVNHVSTDITLKTIIKLAYSLNGPGDYKVLSSNLNDSCFYGSDTCQKGGFLYTPSREFFGGMSVLLSYGTDIENLNNYELLKQYTNIVFNFPESLEKNYKINIFNSLKVNHLAGTLSNDIVRYGFNIPEKNSIGNTKEIYKKSIIYYNNLDENSTILRLFKTFFKGEFKKTSIPIYSKDNANIEIIIGEDYLLDNNPFKF